MTKSRFRKASFLWCVLKTEIQILSVNASEERKRLTPEARNLDQFCSLRLYLLRLSDPVFNE
jgi:hypothetical protein